MQDSVPHLRPMGLADLLDASFALYRRNFALFAGIALLLGVPQSIITSLLAAVAPTVTTSSSSSDQGVQFSSISLGSTGSGGLISFVFGTLITAALALAISRRYLGERATVEGAYVQVGWKGFRRVLGATLLGVAAAIALFVVPIIVFVLAIVSGAALLVVVGAILIVGATVGIFVLLIHWVFAPQAIVIEGLGAVAGLRRSWNVVSGSGWRVFGIYIVLSLMVGILSGIIGGLAGAVFAVSDDRGLKFLANLISSLVVLLIQPFQLTALTLLYFDLRIRKEGFDLEQMVRSLDAAPQT
jgi:hypothetical protein